ncbi:uncharacterized protein PGTG_02325 [Puccinia graminis f. sp. tritici CRL 75-36-700-3]|uniref:Uncharacterized protein n=1 Tax=Puccinia graminis f. sp. tritici (strain CRL 75-36-700-3 / race SCCL) TaxID=418459 RepID=E3JXT9_PUCGT|nr:uncharacterized protein PGTG_02325 [Puccinia graminis f. sp. tritici CRL 75-36-700-3]EFP76864.2 hypothetical protein PGTG_02325 [Puccinia graminis f. sp. tritici CRL 75-36-700-3]
MNSKPQETPPSSSKISKPKLSYPRRFDRASKGAQLKHIAPSPAPPIVHSSMDQVELIPELKASILSILTFQWIQPLLSQGYRRPLVETDLWALDHDRQSDILSDKLLENYRKRQLAAQKDQPAGDPKHLAKASLVRALNDTFFRRFWIAGLCKLISDGFVACTPLVNRALIEYGNSVYRHKLNPDTTPPPHSKAHGYGLAIGLFLMQASSTFFLHQFFYLSMSVGVLSRSALIAAIYKRSLSFSSRSRKQFPTSQLVGHISSDVSRIDVCMGLFHMSWATPIQLAAILAILVLQIGPSSLAGVGFILMLLPLQIAAMGLMFSLRMKVVSWTDKRTRKTQEVLQGVKLLKLFGWEEAFLSIIDRFRVKELNLLHKALVVLAASLALANSFPLLGSVIAFVTYSAMGHGAGNPEAVFTSLSLFNLLGLPLLILPIALGSIADARSGIQRLEKVFEAEVVEEQDEIFVDSTLDASIRVTKSSWVWEPNNADDGDQEKKPDNPIADLSIDDQKNPTHPNPANVTSSFRLTDIEMDIKRGSLTAIVGPIASGKSSLIQALIGEMQQISGSPPSFGGQVSYCPQNAWIQNDTIRDNIIFGSEMDEKRYQAVIHAACLQADLDMLPQGDMTLIGEKGINLSGGQKQRINIARSIYFISDIILFDDPLSAVDAHVAKHVFEHAIRGSNYTAGHSGIGNQTKILVTHALHLLPKVDEIICMNDGKIQERGTFEELLAAGGTFCALYRDFAGGQHQQNHAANQTPEKAETEISTKSPTEKDHNQSVDDRVDHIPKNEPSGKIEGDDDLNQMQQEERVTGSVPWSVYKHLFTAGNGKWLGPLLVISVVFEQSAVVLSSYWLVWWQNAKIQISQATYMGVYASLGIFQTLSGFAMGAVGVTIGFYASKNLHHGALKAITRAPLAFFDTTPLGRIMNRLSKDVDSIDNKLNDSMRMVLTTLSQVIGAIILIGITSRYFLLAMAGVTAGCWLLATFYRPSARDIQRLNNLLRSKLYAQFTESLNGITTIKAYGMKAKSIVKHCRLLDHETRAYYLTTVNQQWLGIRLEGFGSILVFIVAIISVAQAGSINPSQIGLILTYVQTISQSLSWLVRQIAEVENSLNSVERVLWYQKNVPQEAAALLPDTDPDTTWPSGGSIQFDSIVMSYRPGLPQVLKGLSIDVAAGEKIGVVGRTGAGKSSLMLALFRTTELESGSIKIDGVNIREIGLDRLRRSISIIPQDAILFEGTIRTNLDPFDEYDDQSLWDALSRSGLNQKNAYLGETKEKYGLDSVIEDEGVNLSVGERNLVSLARALVKNSKIIVLDEATASVDFETDAKIQETIRKEFGDKTLLCIAHRLRTVINYDKIVVMDGGRAVEIGTPLALYDQETGIFRNMCESSSITRQDIVSSRGSHSSVGDT